MSLCLIQQVLHLMTVIWSCSKISLRLKFTTQCPWHSMKITVFGSLSNVTMRIFRREWAERIRQSFSLTLMKAPPHPFVVFSFLSGNSIVDINISHNEIATLVVQLFSYLKLVLYSWATFYFLTWKKGMHCSHFLILSVCDWLQSRSFLNSVF